MAVLIRSVQLLLFIFATASCVPHRSFVASPYEPVMVEKKGDVQFTGGLRPFKYYSLEATVAPSNFMAIRAAWGGFFGLDNFSLSLPFFENNQRYGFFIAPALNYQRNLINRSIPPFFVTNRKQYRYNCEYLNPAVVLGIKINSFNGISQHWILKVQYNIVNKYEYYFEKDNAAGKSSSYQIFDNETLNYPLQNFFSFEPSCVVLKSINNSLSLKFQLGLNIRQSVLKHDYSFQVGDWTNTRIAEVYTDHPRTLLLNFSFGILFKGNLIRKIPKD
jgi:hypothetical protein